MLQQVTKISILDYLSMQQVTKISIVDVLPIHVATSDLSLHFGLFIYTCCNK